MVWSWAKDVLVSILYKRSLQSAFLQKDPSWKCLSRGVPQTHRAQKEHPKTLQSATWTVAERVPGKSLCDPRAIVGDKHLSILLSRCFLHPYARISWCTERTDPMHIPTHTHTHTTCMPVRSLHKSVDPVPPCPRAHFPAVLMLWPPKKE